MALDVHPGLHPLDAGPRGPLLAVPRRERPADPPARRLGAADRRRRRSEVLATGAVADGGAAAAGTDASSAGRPAS